MVKLTNATEEFVILLHVSSFSPSSTPRPYSPIITNGSGTSTPSGFLPGSSQQEDSGGMGSLSRSKSAQPTSSLKLAVPTPRDGPKSALPAAGFSIPKLEGRASPALIEGPRWPLNHFLPFSRTLHPSILPIHTYTSTVQPQFAYTPRKMGNFSPVQILTKTTAQTVQYGK